MKKTLVALAALAATGAFAQVTISGNLTGTFGAVEYGGAPSRLDISRASGAIAFDATEDLGGGLKSSVRIQQGMYGWGSAGTTAASGISNNTQQNFADRQAFITLAGPFGAVKLGRDLTMLSSATAGVYDVSAVKSINGSNDNTAEAAMLGNVRASQLTYMTPNFGGAVAYIALSPPNYAGLAANTASTGVLAGTTGIAANNMPVAASTAQDTPVAFGVNYSAGPINLSYDSSNFQETFSGANFVASTFAANYDLGVAKFGFGYQSLTGSDKADTTSLVVSAFVPVGAMLTLGGHYASRSAVVNGAWTAKESKHMALGANYNMSKRTTIYAAFFNREVSGGTAEKFDMKETGVGIHHAF